MKSFHNEEESKNEQNIELLVFARSWHVPRDVHLAVVRGFWDNWVWFLTPTSVSDAKSEWALISTAFSLDLFELPNPPLHDWAFEVQSLNICFKN